MSINLADFKFNMFMIRVVLIYKFDTDSMSAMGRSRCRKWYKSVQNPGETETLGRKAELECFLSPKHRPK